MLDKVTPGVVIDLQPHLFHLTLDTTLFMLFGDTAEKIQMSGENAARRIELAREINIAQEHLAYRTRVGDFHWLINGPSMWRACRTVHAFLDDAVKEALSATDERKSQPSEKTRYVFIDALIEQSRDPRFLRDQCLTLMFAGRDFTACCISWALYGETYHNPS
jgi:cytochrome P450